MKNSIIEDLYYSRRGNLDTIKSNAEYAKIHTEICELYNKLVSTLNDKEKEYLDNVYNLNSDMEAESNVENFKEGFKIGLLIGAECFGN